MIEPTEAPDSPRWCATSHPRTTFWTPFAKVRPKFPPRYARRLGRASGAIRGDLERAGRVSEASGTGREE